MSQMNPKIDPEVFKLSKHPAVAMLMHGRINTSSFVRMLTPADPFILLDDTVYAMTPIEFYSLHSKLVYRQLSNTGFQYALEHAKELGITDTDCNYLLNVRDKLPGCPSCRYRQYKEKVSEILHKYSIKLPAEVLKADDDDDIIVVPYSKAVYPEHKTEVVRKIGPRLNTLYNSFPEGIRKSCVDCVEKHITQAFILSREAIMGYPEHLALACGHLEEALAELPKTAEDLFNTLQFCLAKSQYESKGFIPLGVLLSLVNFMRMKEQIQYGDYPQQHKFEGAPDVMEMECNATVKQELQSLLPQHKELLIERLKSTLKAADDTSNTNYIALWEGLMATAAESIAEFAPTAANVLRNRRLMFIGAPELMTPSGYSVEDFITAATE